ncbi:family 43 glycosylhydrolase [Stakelama sp. CBK3Z-3]|uniref:Family 43 glycosylhydrolase n=1 Tax=Stakelama flava TaxID=2860338 RepID=A0ABS6XID0_9SPHN|nr:family 43 glycosylhydrolase [Stakelama flava]MBW4329942.1 family 43 glycosylhydrolase [Stakelama flava]
MPLSFTSLRPASAGFLPLIAAAIFASPVALAQDKLSGSATDKAPVASPHNPLFVGADPDLVSACGRWWLYSTHAIDPKTGWAADRLYAWSSPDLRHWKRGSRILDMKDIGWIKDDGAKFHALWAPSLAEANGRYYFYYSVGPQNPTPSRIGVAVADSPAGPFRDSGKPLLTGGNGFEAIDPMVFIDPASHIPYLYAGGSAGAKLRIFELKPDMTEIAREIPVETPPQFTEGAFMHVRDGVYYLSYSHGHWNGPDYSVHYATAPGPTGPWTYRGAILTADATHQGPGHHSFVRDPSTGRWFIAYHRWERGPGPGPYVGARKVAIEAIHYLDDGRIAPIQMSDGPPPRAPLKAASCTSTAAASDSRGK